jgi:hypothetical protein
VVVVAGGIAAEEEAVAGKEVEGRFVEEWGLGEEPDVAASVAAGFVEH